MNVTITDADIDHLITELNQLDQRCLWYFDETRRNILKEMKSLDIQACPGSGKTSLIAAKLLLLAKKWRAPYQGVCVLSHTNVAKQEIINKLQAHPAGSALLRYPHFIGTIQEFVDRYLAIPYCQSKGIPINHIDDDMAIDYIIKNLKYSTKTYLARKKQRFDQRSNEIVIYEYIKKFIQYYDNKKMEFDVPCFPNSSESDSYKNLVNTKEKAINNGFHFYREMYEYASNLLDENPEIKPSICRRFPILFIDEMQDTSLYQDTLIASIFSSEWSTVQRFGDPDQSIFNGNDEKPNISYNNKTDLVPISDSHRFDTTIADKAKGLSCNQIQLKSNESITIVDPQHTIFIVDNHSRIKVGDAFAQLCLQHPQLQGKTSIIKAIGAVGMVKTGDKDLTIPHYFPHFDKAKTTTVFNSDKLIDYFHYVTHQQGGHNSENYSSRIKGVLKLVRLAGLKHTTPARAECHFTKTTLLQKLQEEHKKIAFNQLLLQYPVNETEWNDFISQLVTLLGIPLNDKIRDFVTFQIKKIEETAKAITFNQHLYQDDHHSVIIDIGTIHSIKGETHDATLILECKNRKEDIAESLGYILCQETLNKKSVSDTKQKRIKQLYVAMTRPKHLLCLAIDKERISDAQKTQAHQLGWNIQDLTI